MELTLGWPQLIWVAISVLGLCITVADHGKMHRTNAGHSFLAFLLMFVILYWGGFFS